MGKLVRFDKWDRPITEQTPTKRPGKVLIFTGVRYERAADDSEAGKSGPPKLPANRKRKRG